VSQQCSSSLRSRCAYRLILYYYTVSGDGDGGATPCSGRSTWSDGAAGVSSSTVAVSVSGGIGWLWRCAPESAAPRRGRKTGEIDRGVRARVFLSTAGVSYTTTTLLASARRFVRMGARARRKCIFV